VAAPAEAGPDLTELWQQILASLELPSTRMLLSQQAALVRLDGQRAVVRVSGNWIAMVQSRLPLLEKAVESALGAPRQLVLEGSREMAAAPPAPARATPAPQGAPPPAPPAPQPQPTDRAAKGAASPPAHTGADPLEERARRLADFFNGEVIVLEESGGGQDNSAA
jgi:DNA polymerase-3 subunit gamma/tau